MGGRGVTIIAPFQSRAQLLARYGEHKTATILNNTGSVMLFGGTRDQADLQFWSTLAGERDERITTTDLHGRVASRTVRKVPVLAPAQIANLPAGKVVVYPPRDRPGDRAGAHGLARRDVRAHRRSLTPTGGPGWRTHTARLGAWCRVGMAALIRWWGRHRPAASRPSAAPGSLAERRESRPFVVDGVEPTAPPVIDQLWTDARRTDRGGERHDR